MDSALLCGTLTWGSLDQEDHIITERFWSHYDINRSVQERRNSSALAMELRLSCTNPLIWLIFCINTHMRYEMSFVSSQYDFGSKNTIAAQHAMLHYNWMLYNEIWLWLNSLFPQRCGCICKLIIQSAILSTSCEIVLRWVLQNSIDDKSTLI